MLLDARRFGIVERPSIRRLVAEDRVLDRLRAFCGNLWNGLLGDDRTIGNKSFESESKTSNPAGMGQGFLVRQFDSYRLALFRVILPAGVLQANRMMNRHIT
jgi:hypothetical protein